MNKILNRVPEITLFYWIIKIAATTLGETGADAFSMTLNLGYGVASIIFISMFFVFLTVKLWIKQYDPLLYWLVFISTSIAGTAMCDFMDRTLSLGYTLGSIFLMFILLVILGIWRFQEKTISVEKVHSMKTELFYWSAFLFANTLGTAAGDFLADDLELGFLVSAGIITTLLLIVALLYYLTKLSSVMLFWTAFVLTRPFGATFGDLLTKPIKAGGMNLGTIGSSLIFGAILSILIFREMQSHKKQKVKSSLQIKAKELPFEPEGELP